MSSQKTPGQIEILHRWIDAANVFTIKCGQPFEFLAFVEATIDAQKDLKLRGGNDLRPAYSGATKGAKDKKFETLESRFEFTAQQLLCGDHSKFSEDIHAVSSFIVLYAANNHVLENRDLSPKIANMLLAYKCSLNCPDPV